MQCRLLKLSRVLRPRLRPESRPAAESAGQARCGHGAQTRSPSEPPSNAAKSEREFGGWTVSLDNFS